MMHLLKWSAAMAAGFMPVLGLGEEPAARVEGGTTAEIRISGTPVRAENGPVIVVLDDGDRERANPPVASQRDRQVRVRLDNEVRHGLTFALDGVKQEKGAYLGVAASPPPPVLRKQLGLPPGMGLVVDFAVPDGPAGKAGLQQFDVLQKLDDQLIVNQEQLAVLVRSHKPGDEVKLGVIHEGKPATLTVKLAEHELEPLAEAGGEAGQDVYKLFVRSAPEPQVGHFPPAKPQQWGNPWPGAVGASSVTWIEGDHSYTIVTNAQGHKTFSEKDNDGKVVFETPIDTKEQRDKLPDDQKEKLKRMEQHMPAGSGAIVGPYGNSREVKLTTQPAKPGNEGEQK